MTQVLLKRSLLLKALKGENNFTIEALSFAAKLRHDLNYKGYLHNYSINKLRAVTGCAASTCKKYITVLLREGLAVLNGTTLELRRISSGTKHRNIPITQIDYTNFRSVVTSLYTLPIIDTINRKEKVVRSIRCRNNPCTHIKKGYRDDFKANDKFCKKYVKPAPNGNYEVKELGLSYEGMSQRNGKCRRTNFNYIKRAIRNGWITKLHPKKKVIYTPYCNGFVLDDYTYAYKHNNVKVYANTYKLSKQWREEYDNIDNHLNRHTLTQQETDEYYANREIQKDLAIKRDWNKFVAIAEDYKNFGITPQYLKGFHRRPEVVARIMHHKYGETGAMAVYPMALNRVQKV